MLKLQPREIVEPLSGTSDSAANPIGASFDEHYNWLDSSLDLAHGLDVISLPDDTDLPATRQPQRVPPRTG